MALGTSPYDYGSAGGPGQLDEAYGTPGGGAAPENAQWPQNFGDPQVFGITGGEGSGMSTGGYRPFTQSLKGSVYPDGAPAGTNQAGPVYTGYPGNSSTRTDRAVSSLLPATLETMNG